VKLPKPSGPRELLNVGKQPPTYSVPLKRRVNVEPLGLVAVQANQTDDPPVRLRNEGFHVLEFAVEAIRNKLLK
jgi:hypothetical protein